MHQPEVPPSRLISLSIFRLNDILLMVVMTSEPYRPGHNPGKAIVNKLVHFFVILSMLFGPLSEAQAEISTPASKTYSSKTAQPLDGKDGLIPKDRNSGRYDPNNPAYFNSLRWLVYALILFLPFSPSRVSSPAADPSGIKPGALANLHE